MRARGLAAAALLLAGTAPADPPSRAAITVDEAGKAKLVPDLRLRLETDRDSRDPGGAPRDDRTRVRARARLAFLYDPSDAVQLGLRVRSGDEGSQQSPHITILESGGNPGAKADFVLDQWYVRLARRGWAVKAGRFAFPYWRQNELFWDEDATPAGVAGSYTLAGERHRLTFQLGAFSLPDGMTRLHGSLAAGQVVLATGGEGRPLTVAAGFFRFDGEPGAVHLRNGNGARDYAIWTASAQWRASVGGRPLALGADLLHNAEDYASGDSDPFTAAHAGETDGWVLSLLYGRSEARGDWLLGYHYARIETFAVNASFAQDDWVRWGSGAQTDASDLEGHELRAVHRLAGPLEVMARMYLVDAITSVQDGKRFRLDFNWRF